MNDDFSLKRKLGIKSECLRGVSSKDALRLIKNVGFDCYFTAKSTLKEVAPIIDAGASLGLSCEAIHAPFAEISKIWRGLPDYLNSYNSMKTAIDTAYNVGVSCVVLHSSSVSTYHKVSDFGTERYDELVYYAGEKGVNIAFENLMNKENLLYLIDRYKNVSNVGFCYDLGHENCFTPKFKWMEHFKGKVLTTHIHDNFGPLLSGEIGDCYSADTHLLPFEGDIDFSWCISELNKYNYTGALVIEASNFPVEGPKAAKARDLSSLSNEEYIALAYERLKKVSEL